MCSSDLAGGLSWHQQPQFDVGSLSGVAMRPRQLWHTPIPIGLGMCSFPSFHQYNNKYVYQYDLFHITGESYHDTSSGSGYFGDDGTSDFISQQAYDDILQTPPPPPTQDTQPEMEERGYVLPPRNRRAPDHLSLSGRRPRQPQRRGRTRIQRQDD